MQIPLAYADAVIGKAGASISYIRRASGATITIQESNGVPSEMTVEINGAATQVQTAQQLIQASFLSFHSNSSQIVMETNLKHDSCSIFPSTMLDCAYSFIFNYKCMLVWYFYL